MKIVIVGAGAVGSYLAERFSLEGQDVVVIESSTERAAQMQSELDCLVITGNGAGRWYNYHTSHGHMPLHRDNRCIAIVGKKGGGPLRF